MSVPCFKMPDFVPNRIVALLTDFGLTDPYVAVMKAVILQRVPNVTFVDISHDVPPQDVWTAAFILREAFPWFPKGTIFLVVVDPGVGTDQQKLAVLSQGRILVGPDNGVLSLVYQEPLEAYGLPTPPDASTTFHGRDLYARAVADLLSGKSPHALGPSTRPSSYLSIPEPTPQPDGLLGEVIHIDRFGNLITNIQIAHCTGRSPKAVILKTQEIPMVQRYADVEPGAPLALWGSFGHLEISIRDGNAAEFFGAQRGTPIQALFP